ncbi:MAG: thioredoxin family protein [Candidatus Eisenbacteria bacterium]
MKIQILGPGCPKCKKAFEHARQAIEELGGGVELEKIEDLKSIMTFGVMVTPAVAVDGDVKTSGKLPSVDDFKRMIGEKRGA